MAQALRSRQRESTTTPNRIPTRRAHIPHPRSFRQRHHAAAIAVVVVLAVVTFQLFPGRDVTVIKDGTVYRVSTTFDTEGDALAAAAVELEPGDRVSAGFGGSEASVAVQRARPVVIEVDGEVIELRTHAVTIAGALAEAGVSLSNRDMVMLEGRAAGVRAALSSVAYVSRDRAVSHEVAALQPRELRLSVVRAKPVTVFVDTLAVDVSSTASTVQGVLEEIGMTVREQDLVRPSLDTPVTAGLNVRLARAKSVNLRLDGVDQVLYTQARTVGDVLAVLGVDPGPNELLDPPRETLISSGMSIVVGLTKTVTETVDELIPPTTVYETDATLPAGQVRVIPGAPGLLQRTYTVTFENGVETQRSIAGPAAVARHAVPTRHITGTMTVDGSRPTLDVPGYQGPYRAKITVRATWYNASHGAWARDDPNYGRTASGIMLDYGICAVDPNVIPLGTRFYVPGYGTCLAADTGGAVKGNHVDLGFPEEAGSNPWYTQTLDIYILE